MYYFKTVDIKILFFACITRLIKTIWIRVIYAKNKVIHLCNTEYETRIQEALLISPTHSFMLVVVRLFFCILII